MFNNTIIININEIDYSASKSVNQVISLFEELIKINKPYYACLTSDSAMVGLDGSMKPKSVCWLNYWDKTILDNVTMDCDFSNLIVNEIESGIMVTFEDLDINNPLQKQINESILK